VRRVGEGEVVVVGRRGEREGSARGRGVGREVAVGFTEESE
jgi:hypothetical protein